MKATAYDETLRVRMSEGMLESVREGAEHEESNVSEFTRGALRDRLRLIQGGEMQDGRAR